VISVKILGLKFLPYIAGICADYTKKGRAIVDPALVKINS